MNKVIETPRLILRTFCMSDAQHLFELNADPEVIRYTGDSPFASVSDAKLFLENYSEYTKNGYGRWAVISKDSGQFLGWCGLKLNEEGFVDLGFRFFKNQWGKGYATESAKASLDYGFNHLGIEEIIGRAALANNASVRVLEKLNMVFWKMDTCRGIENAAWYRISAEQFNDRR